MNKVSEIDSDFARWYAEAFMDESSKRDQRWKGVIHVADKADSKTTEVLTRLAFQTPVPATGRKSEDLGDVYKAITSNISGGDATFDPSQSERELQILSAAVLVRLFKNSPDAALNVSTASFGGVRRPSLPMDLVGLAEKALVELSSKKHVRAGIDELKLAVPKIEFSVAAEAIQSMDPSQWKTQFDRLRAATDKAIGHVVAGQNRVVSNLHLQIMLDQEELQMLWWLVGGYSRSNEKTFSEIDALIKPLLLAHELGEMTVVSPGPVSIRAMLSRAGIGKDDVKVVDAVNATSQEWAKTVTSSKLVSPATTPIHFALEQRAELGSADAWQVGWSTLTGLTVDVSLPSILLAELFYREHLFLFVGD